ncbi:hypothetical protein ACFL1S_02945 [Pseudomonadota bacterium]
MTVERFSPSALIVADSAELPNDRGIWGTGGWVMPGNREALDWLTLVRILGWDAEVVSLPTLEKKINSREWRWIIVACDPELLDSRLVDLLAYKLAEAPVLMLLRAGNASLPVSKLTATVAGPETISGRHLKWLGSGGPKSWVCRKPLKALRTECERGVESWVTLEDMPLITAKRIGCGVVATLAFHPSEARDESGIATALLRHLLIQGSSGPVAWFDFEGVMILRMDDPGGAQNVYSRDWRYCKLNEEAWRAVGHDLRQRNARLSIGYVSGWVDDADAARGKLLVGGKTPARKPGNVYPSPLVKYWDIAGFSPGDVYDYQSEYRGIQALRREGLAEVELHGYTHMHPDTKAWIRAPDRYENWPATSWYRELGEAARGTIASRPPELHPLELGQAAIQRFFDTTPSTLIPPGDQWTDESLERALEVGIQLVSSYYLAILDHGRFCWTQHVCAPYLDSPDQSWFDAGLPVVGYFHDYELACEGVGWMTALLDQWQSDGARWFIDFREFSNILSHRVSCSRDGECHRISVTSTTAKKPLLRPIRLGIYLPDSGRPSRITVLSDGIESEAELDPKSGGFFSASIA